MNDYNNNNNNKSNKKPGYQNKQQNIILVMFMFLVLVIMASSASNTNIFVDNSFNETINVPDGKIPVNIHDSDGEKIGSLNGAINIHDADVHNDMMNHFLVYKNGTQTTLTNPALKDQYNITVVNAAIFNVGEYIDIQNGTKHIHTYKKIIAINGNTITLGSRLDQDHINNSRVQLVTFNMNLAGTLADPITFKFTPAEDEVVHITRILPTIISSAAADDSKFGGGPALTNGIVIRINYNNGERYDTLTVWRNNQDMKEDMYDVTYSDKAGAGLYGVNGRWTFTNAGIVVRLNGTQNDSFEALIQDDLTGYTDIQDKLQGHFEEYN